MMAEKCHDVSTEGQVGLGIGGQTNESKVSFEPQSVRINSWQKSSFSTFSKYDWFLCSLRDHPVNPSTQKSCSLLVGNATRTAFKTATRSMISWAIAPPIGGR
jgi:hypothetical protein